MICAFRSVVSDDKGQGLAEYGVILGLIAVLCIAALASLGGNISAILKHVGSTI